MCRLHQKVLRYIESIISIEKNAAEWIKKRCRAVAQKSAEIYRVNNRNSCRAMNPSLYLECSLKDSVE